MTGVAVPLVEAAVGFPFVGVLAGIMIRGESGVVVKVFQNDRENATRKQYWYSIVPPPGNTRHTARDSLRLCLPPPLPSVLPSAFDEDISSHNSWAVSSNWRGPALPWRRQRYTGSELLHSRPEDAKLCRLGLYLQLGLEAYDMQLTNSHL